MWHDIQMLPRSPVRAAGASPLAAQGDCSLGEGQAPVAWILLLLSVMSGAQIKEILSCLIPLGADIHDHIQPCSQGNTIAQTNTAILPRQFGFVACFLLDTWPLTCLQIEQVKKQTNKTKTLFIKSNHISIFLPLACYSWCWYPPSDWGLFDEHRRFGSMEVGDLLIGREVIHSCSLSC